MRSEAERRRRYTDSERAKLLAGYRQSGLTQGEFAARNGLSLSCLSIWLRRSRKVEVKSSRPALFRLPVDLTPGRPAGAAYRIGFPGGHSLEVAAGFRVEELRELCQLLQAL